MLLPKNGRIVVIDDSDFIVLPDGEGSYISSPGEGVSLVKALNKHGYSTLYFTGTDKNEYPSSPLKDVSVVFLDLELGTGGASETDKINSATQALKSVISIYEECSYLLIFWTQHKDLITPVLDKLSDKKCHFETIELDKSECSANDYDIAYISGEISNKLIEKESYKYMFYWDNIIHDSSHNTLTLFSNLYSRDENWNNKTLGVYKKLAEAYAGKQLEKNNHDAISKNAMLAFNGTFRDSLENTIQAFKSDISFEEAESSIDSNVAAQINTKLLIDLADESAPRPGNVLLENEESKHKTICSEYTNYCAVLDDYAAKQEIGVDEILDNNCKVVKKHDKEFKKHCKGYRKEFCEQSYLVSCELSPNCDYSQDKWKVHRYLFGILAPVSFMKYSNDAEYLVTTPVIEYNEKEMFMAFDMRHIYTETKGNHRKSGLIFSLKHDLVVMIQHKLAGHSSRPGIVNLRWQ